MLIVSRTSALGDCVPFYFCPRSPMLYTITRGTFAQRFPIPSEVTKLIVHLESDAPSSCWTGQYRMDLRWVVHNDVSAASERLRRLLQTCPSSSGADRLGNRSEPPGGAGRAARESRQSSSSSASSRLVSWIRSRSAVKTRDASRPGRVDALRQGVMPLGHLLRSSPPGTTMLRSGDRTDASYVQDIGRPARLKTPRRSSTA